MANDYEITMAGELNTLDPYFEAAFRQAVAKLRERGHTVQGTIKLRGTTQPL